jgi:phosphatidylcholine synthase
VASAWLVHLYTASGALFAFFSLDFIIKDRYREAFFWLALSVVVDATDGVLARRVGVAARLPWFNGDTLDKIVDYLTYVFVPAFVVWQVPLVPAGWGLVVPCAMLLSSVYGFSRDDAKTADYFFTGFPSYWNIVVFYLYLAAWPVLVNAAVLLALALLAFVPVRYVYPSRTLVLRSLTIGLGIVWGVLMVIMIWLMPAVPSVVFWMSLIFPLYYAALSLVLDRRWRNAQAKNLHIDDR